VIQKPIERSSRLTARRQLLAGALLLAALASACKDDEPCDPGQVSIGTACFPAEIGGSGGSTGAASAGAPSDGGDAAGGEPAQGGPRTPDASFGTPCETNADCGGDAPVCATDPLFYCSQLDCDVGEANDGVCPEGWTCLKYLDNPSACVNLSSL
jgi:hypothetical protein